MKHEIGEIVKLKFIPKQRWKIIEINDGFYTLVPIDWDREIVVGTITDDQIQDQIMSGKDRPPRD